MAYLVYSMAWLPTKTVRVAASEEMTRENAVQVEDVVEFTPTRSPIAQRANVPASWDLPDCSPTVQPTFSVAKTPMMTAFVISLLPAPTTHVAAKNETAKADAVPETLVVARKTTPCSTLKENVYAKKGIPSLLPTSTTTIDANLSQRPVASKMAKTQLRTKSVVAKNAMIKAGAVQEKSVVQHVTFRKPLQAFVNALPGTLGQPPMHKATIAAKNMNPHRASLMEKQQMPRIVAVNKMTKVAPAVLG
jgi:hypothetical protein